MLLGQACGSMEVVCWEFEGFVSARGQVLAFKCVFMNNFNCAFTVVAALKMEKASC